MCKQKRNIKCLVWDLDNTIWTCSLSETSSVSLRDGVLETIKELDHRGILQSISSKNEEIPAMEKLKELGIDEYFIYPQICWGPKSESIKKISEALNIGIGSMAFIDDQKFERDEVSFYHPNILCLDAAEIQNLLEMEEMTLKYMTDDSSNRRILYQKDIVRKEKEKKFEGTKEEFLKTLKMKVSINPAKTDDLIRMEELTVRTHQLNSTGYIYSYDELKGFINSSGYKLLACELNDIYGTYGKIGMGLIEIRKNIWMIKLLLMSCRTMGKGIGSILLLYMMNRARKENVILQAEFRHTEHNKMLFVTFMLIGFYIKTEYEDYVVLEHDLKRIRPYPDYIQLEERN